MTTAALLVVALASLAPPPSPRQPRTPPPAVQRFTAPALAGGEASVTREPFRVSFVGWPLADRLTPVSSPFGLRAARPCPACNLFHRGTDFSRGTAGAEVRSVAAGVVVEVGAQLGDYGTFVRVEHDVRGERFESVYAHLVPGSVPAAVGQVVALGAPVGLVGSSGDSTGPHLHLEIRVGGVPVDSLAWLAARVP